VVVVDRPSSGSPSSLSCSTSTWVALYRIYHSQASTASSCGALICLSSVCHSDWQEQIPAIAADVVEPDAGPEV
jgi:hypothetical protein